MFNGIINIYKEKGYTSHDVVAKARRILSEKRIGHTGTLDPQAEGVLPLCIGQATKVVQYITDADKCYEAEVILGAYTTTEDQTGEVVETFDVKVTKEEVEQAVASFKGTYHQIPPMYSAIKINGVRLYELARKGIIVERPKREVKIYDCKIISWLTEKKFKIQVHCSKGTYIRTLCTDIGQKLGCGAYMGDLLRTKAGMFTLENSISLGELEADKQHIMHYLYPLEDIFSQYPKVYIKSTASKRLCNGNKLVADDFFDLEVKTNQEFIRVYDGSGHFMALYRFDRQDNDFKVEKMFNNQ